MTNNRNDKKINTIIENSNKPYAEKQEVNNKIEEFEKDTKPKNNKIVNFLKKAGTYISNHKKASAVIGAALILSTMLAPAGIAAISGIIVTIGASAIITNKIVQNRNKEIHPPHIIKNNNGVEQKQKINQKQQISKNIPTLSNLQPPPTTPNLNNIKSSQGISK